jgi:hypothetical protein
MEKHALVLTTVNAPTDSVRSLCAGALRHDWTVIVAADEGTPRTWSSPGALLVSFEEQLSDSWALGPLLPKGHYSRKNMGYLMAISSGCSVIVETDDDNWPEEPFWRDRVRELECDGLASSGAWANAYAAFTSSQVWPRGFPLDEVRNACSQRVSAKGGLKPMAVQQALVTGDPDVDAVYRLVVSEPVRWHDGRPVAIRKGEHCPFNSQNTTWWREAWPLLYLPSGCSMRMTDIYRSFVAQAYLVANDVGLAFCAPSMRQDRNPHDLMNDFAQEVAGYVNAKRFVDALPDPAGAAPGNYLRLAYVSLVEAGLMPETEVHLVDAWLSDVSRLEALHPSATAGGKWFGPPSL